MVPEAQATQRYAHAVGELWNGLARTLGRLETLAAAPERLAEDDGIEELRLLQYRLHTASERTVGLSPPAASASAHGELAAALLDARDATGELAEALSLEGAAALSASVYEWRVALFRVRMARLELAGARRAPAPEPEEPSPGLAPVAALTLSLGGTAAFVVGATLGPWPLWVFGAAALCSSLLVYRP